jgi:hypothetical protein
MPPTQTVVSRLALDKLPMESCHRWFLQLIDG